MDAIIAALIGVVGMLISGGFLWLRSEIVLLRNRMDERFADIDVRFADIDKRFADIDKRFADIDVRFDGIDKRCADIDKRFDGIEESIRAQGEQIARIEGREEAIAGG